MDQHHRLQDAKTFPPDSSGRRRLVLAAIAAGALAAFGSLSAFDPRLRPFGSAWAQGAGGTADLDTFVKVSQQLTGRSHLDAALGARIFEALAATDDAFATHVEALSKWLAAHGGVPSDTVTQALRADDNAVLAKAVTAIMSGWYLGVVGEVPRATVVSYEQALMFDPVRDVLTIPSYCHDVPGYWARRPGTA